MDSSRLAPGRATLGVWDWAGAAIGFSVAPAWLIVNTAHHCPEPCLLYICRSPTHVKSIDERSEIIGKLGACTELGELPRRGARCGAGERQPTRRQRVRGWTARPGLASAPTRRHWSTAASGFVRELTPRPRRPEETNRSFHSSDDDAASPPRPAPRRARRGGAGAGVHMHVPSPLVRLKLRSSGAAAAG